MDSDIERPDDLKALGDGEDIVIELKLFSACLPAEIAAMGSQPPVPSAVPLTFAEHRQSYSCRRLLRARPDDTGRPTKDQTTHHCQPSLAAPPAGGLTAPPRCARPSLNLPTRCLRNPDD